MIRQQFWGNGEPFDISRQLIENILTTEELTECETELRPITHVENLSKGSLSDRQTIHDQLRFYTKDRCIRGFRKVAYLLSERNFGGLEIEVKGLMHQSDLDFLNALAEILPVNVAQSASSDQRKKKCYLLDEYDSMDHPGWKDFHLEISKLLNYGDSWTACWLADYALENNRNVPEKAGDAIGLAYGLQGRFGDAEIIFRKWSEGDGLDSIRAKYSLAMMYARHHPLALRDNQKAEELLNSAWEQLAELDNTVEEVVYEKVFNRNGLALLMFRKGDFDLAAEMLEDGIKQLENTKFARGVHRTVLANNLGRVYSAKGDHEKAEYWLKDAIELDRDFPEYWADLASFYMDVGRYEEALDVAVKASDLGPEIPEIREQIAFCFQELGDLKSAVAAIDKAIELSADKASAQTTKLSYLMELEEYEEAANLLSQIDKRELGKEFIENLKISEIEINSFLHGWSPVEVIKALESASLELPNSKLLSENLEMVKKLVGSE